MWSILSILGLVIFLFLIFNMFYCGCSWCISCGKKEHFNPFYSPPCPKGMILALDRQDQSQERCCIAGELGGGCRIGF